MLPSSSRRRALTPRNRRSKLLPELAFARFRPLPAFPFRLSSFVRARAIGESGLRRPWATAELHPSSERPSFPELVPRSAGAMAFRTAENPLARGTEPNALPGMQYDSSTINNRAASEAQVDADRLATTTTHATRVVHYVSERYYRPRCLQLAIGTQRSRSRKRAPNHGF